MATPISAHFTPETISDQADIEQPIREALADAPAHVIVDVPGMRLQLDFCCYPDGTPLWDKPLNGSLATVTAHRPDGETLTIPLSDAHGWKHLTSELMEFQEPWEEDVTLAMGRLAHTGSRYKQLEAELKELGHERRAMVLECAKLGVIPARLAEAARTSQTAIGKMLPKKA